MVAVFAIGPDWWLGHAAFPLGFACRESWEKRSRWDKESGEFIKSSYVGDGRAGRGKVRPEVWW